MIDINMIDNTVGMTPLMWAIYNGNYEVTEYLLSMGADPNILVFEGRSKTALDLAIRIQRDGFHFGMTGLDSKTSITKISLIIKTLKDNGAKTYQEILQALRPWPSRVNEGVDIEQKNKFGETALLVALYDMNMGMIKYLLEKGANPNKASKGLKTPYEYAGNMSHKDGLEGRFYKKAFDLLSEYMVKNHGWVDEGIDIDQRDKWGHTPLFAAIYEMNYDAVKFLLEAGANFNLTVGEGGKMTLLGWLEKRIEDFKKSIYNVTDFGRGKIASMIKIKRLLIKYGAK